MLSKDNWAQTRKKWDGYWRRENQGTPLMRIVAEVPSMRDQALEKALEPVDMIDKYDDAARMDARFRYYLRTHRFLAESFPNIDLNYGPGSMAGYLGSEILFAPDTVWFTECVDDWSAWPELRFDPDNKWFKRHLKLFHCVKALAGDDYYLTVPDIMENLDVIASLRGAQNTAYDLIDEPEEIHRRIDQVQACYYRYYDSFYDIVAREEDGVLSSAYTAFQIWGRGKTLKLQCDYAALLSPAQFREFVVPALDQQCAGADSVLYHLDGPDAIRSLPALMEVDGIDALQWTSGSYNPDGTFPQWFGIYDQVKRAGKGLWVQVYNDGVDQWIERIDTLVRRYGSNALFLNFPDMDMASADRLITYAEKNWADVDGSVR